MLAVETGWTPDMIRDLPGQFRGACHWVLYGRRLAGNGLEEVVVSLDAPPEDRLDAMRENLHRAELRALLFPEDE